MDIQSLLPQLSPTRPLTLGGIPVSAQGYVIAQLAAAGQGVLHIVPSDREMEACAHGCRFFAPKAEVLTFPAWDCLPYDRVSPAHNIIAHRIDTLSRLAVKSDKPRIIITTIGAAIQKLPPHDWLTEASFLIAPGQALELELLVMFLVANGYGRVGKVMEPGEFAVRGGIIDIFPPGHEDAVRIDLFGTEIETLKTFDPLSQISNGTLPELHLKPVSEVVMTEAAVERFRTSYRDRFGAVTKDDPLYESVSANRHYAGMEHWLPLFYEKLETIFDYIPKAIITFDHQIEPVRHDRLELLDDYYSARQQSRRKDEPAYHPLPPGELYLLEEEWKKRMNAHSVAVISSFRSDNTETSTNTNAPSPLGEAASTKNQGISLDFSSRRVRGGTANTDSTVNALPPRPLTLTLSQGRGNYTDIGIRPAPDFSGIRNQADGDVFASVKSAIETRGKSALIACYTAGSLDRLKTMLASHGMQPQLAVLPIEHGFETPDLFLLTEQDILGERIIRTQKRKRHSEAFMAEAAAFSEGELVVHKEHGIGRFDGLVTVEVGDKRHDCLKLVYAGDDKLFLPVENMEVISRFGSESDGVQLDKLGGVAWQRRKAAMKQRIKIAAEELLKIAAKRATRQGTELEPHPGAYGEFCARFPYNETEDQQTAIDDVLGDLVKGTPMDRLICGDVGFGKTEVAMRAAFAAVSADSPVQVAIVAPTTLLARQHYQNFLKRFDGLPYLVRGLSRLIPAKEATDTKKLLAEGKVDIVIGTHALLSKQVEFKNLGLVIVDEEQHFGVAQKERLKKLRANVHVLTLSATPIPRTLQMALSGVRELSLITTPPVDRLAIRSFVMPFDGLVIREAILRELHRGGKTFYVTPRINYMAELKTKLHELVPEIKIAVAHGQMPPKELDTIMNEFYEGKYDLLLSTAIIESGLDVPTANTMIIDHAEMFGLAQLYQLRGRVGRGKIRAYAYFTLPHRKALTPTAMKRLDVMQTLDTLGAGFTLASHDMDIRGFGNLLGEEQSGHVREVGIELYQTMLEEMIAQLRRGDLPDEAAEAIDDWSPQINLGTSVLIPESYVEDLDLRLSLYRRLASMHVPAEIESFAAELVDRFGPLPPEVLQLLDVLRIKQLCKQAGIERIDTGPKGAVFSFRHNSFANPRALLEHIAKHPKLFKIRPDQKLVYMDKWRNEQERFVKINRSIETIAGLAA